MPTIPDRNRKSCAACHADVTFAHRVKQADGKLLCQRCAKPDQQPASQDHVPAPTKCASCNAPLTKDRVASGKLVCIECQPVGKQVNEKATSKTNGPTSPSGLQSRPRMKPTRWAAFGVVSAVAIIGLSAYVITRPSWERLNSARIETLYLDAQQLLRTSKPKESYQKFRELFAFIGDHKITDLSIRQDLDAAGPAMSQAYAMAKPIIEREEAEAKLRQEEQQRQEQTRIATEAAEHQEQQRLQKEQEIAKLEQERLAREQAARKQRETLARALFRQSEQYTSLTKAADKVINDLRSDLILEDSAYRSMSRRAGASRDLLAIYLRIQGKLNGLDLSRDIDQVLKASEAELLNEDSAIRAIYKKDEAFFELLGIWCRILARDKPKLPSQFSKHRLDALKEDAVDDSAPRAIMRYATASLAVLSDIVATTSKSESGAKIVHKVEAANAIEDSSWRASMRYVQGNLGLLLEILDQDNDPTVRQIRMSVELSATTDDSALRIQSECRQGIVDALHLMITSE